MAQVSPPAFNLKAILLVLLIGLPTVGQGDPPSVHMRDADRIHQGDVIEVDVVGSFEYDWRGSLNPEGFLDRFEKVTEPIYARCLSPADLSAKITREYSRLLRDPIVVVRIIDRNGRATGYIDGAVRYPQRFKVKRDVYLNELIVLAGGIIDTAGGEINIFRPDNVSCEGAGNGYPTGSSSRIIKISDVLAGSEGSNPKIVSGEVVTVVESLPIYVIGGVNNPRKIASRGEMTLSRAVASAGGIAKNGTLGTVTVFRREAGGSKVIEADLDKIMAGSAADPKLEPFDIVDVPQKGASKRRFPPVIDERLKPLRAQSLPLRVID